MGVGVGGGEEGGEWKLAKSLDYALYRLGASRLFSPVSVSRLSPSALSSSSVSSSVSSTPANTSSAPDAAMIESDWRGPGGASEGARGPGGAGEGAGGPAGGGEGEGALVEQISLHVLRAVRKMLPGGAGGGEETDGGEAGAARRRVGSGEAEARSGDVQGGLRDGWGSDGGSGRMGEGVGADLRRSVEAVAAEGKGVERRPGGGGAVGDAFVEREGVRAGGGQMVGAGAVSRSGGRGDEDDIENVGQGGCGSGGGAVEGAGGEMVTPLVRASLVKQGYTVRD